jgi:hypothetical protein
MKPDDGLPAITRVTLRTPLDALALVPFALGFHPERSLVLLTTTPDGRPFHARVDLPEQGPAGKCAGGAAGGAAGGPGSPGPLDRLAMLEQVTEQVAAAAATNRAEVAVLVAYTHIPLLAEVAVAILGERLLARDVHVVMALRADGMRWFPVGEPDHPGTPYDVRDHPLTAEGVLAGRVTLSSRAALVESLVPREPRDVEEVARAAARLLRRTGPAADPTAEAEWFKERVRRRPGEALEPGEVARALVGLRHVRTRDLVWAAMTRHDASRWVDLLREVVRRTPGELVAAPAALLGFAAWLAGDGALAWCAVDRARAADPGHRLAALVAETLDRAVPPSAWVPPDPDEIRRAGA